MYPSFRFQSTRPSRDGTVRAGIPMMRNLISIHPSLAGRDRNGTGNARTSADFNPPVPRGTGPERLRRACYEMTDFNPPVPRGTGLFICAGATVLYRFQSTRPSRDGTSVRSGLSLFGILFQSTRPSRDGTCTDSPIYRIRHVISIHPSLAGRDCSRSQTPCRLQISIHPSLAGRDGRCI